LQDAIFNSANFSSIATDEKGVIQLFNVGAERMLCPILHPAAGRKPFDTGALSTDSRAYRATQVAADVIESPTQEPGR
jgi:sensor histidine kinase regulating citrate/malate metabolism